MLYLLIDKIEEFFPPHPSRQKSNEGHIYKKHTIRSLIKHSLMHSDVIMISIIIAFQRKSSNCLLKYVIAHLPALIFVKFVDYFYDACLSVRKVLNLCNFSEYPTSFRMLTIY